MPYAFQGKKVGFGYRLGFFSQRSNSRKINSIIINNSDYIQRIKDSIS